MCKFFSFEIFSDAEGGGKTDHIVENINTDNESNIHLDVDISLYEYKL